MRTRYYKLQNQNQNQNQSKTTSTTATHSPLTSTTNAHTRARNGYEQETVRSEYRLCVGQITDYIAYQLDAWLERAGREILLYAIHETAMAPRPSWRYCLAILTRCEAQGITPEQAEHDDTLSQGGYRQSYNHPLYEPPIL